jgi:hypothetical protein
MISWLPGGGGLIHTRSNRPLQVGSFRVVSAAVCVGAVAAGSVCSRTSSTPVATWFWQTEGCVRSV